MTPTITPGNRPRTRVAAAGTTRVALAPRPETAPTPSAAEVADYPSGSCMYISTITRR
jgi:hypothetical protein